MKKLLLPIVLMFCATMNAQTLMSELKANVASELNGVEWLTTAQVNAVLQIGESATENYLYAQEVESKDTTLFGGFTTLWNIQVDEGREILEVDCLKFSIYADVLPDSTVQRIRKEKPKTKKQKKK